MIPGFAQRRQFRNLSEQEVLALAISSEEDDARIYRWYAQRLRGDYPQSARVFEEMAVEEDGHRAGLLEEHRRRFGDAIPLIRREHVAGFYNRRPVWLIQNLSLERIRDEAARMESEARDFYLRAAQRTSDAGTRELLGRLAAAESGHESTWHELLREHLPPGARGAEDAEAHRQFVLTWVQPGLAGLMDGSVSSRKSRARIHMHFSRRQNSAENVARMPRRFSESRVVEVEVAHRDTIGERSQLGG